MKQTYYRKAKSEKRKAKNKKNLDFDQMDVCIWQSCLINVIHSLTQFLTHSLTQTLFMYADNSNNMTQPYDRKAKSEKRRTKRI